MGNTPTLAEARIGRMRTDFSLRCWDRPWGAVLLALSIWGFCRAYYFAFYVIEKYVDPEFRFSGLLSFAYSASAFSTINTGMERR